MSSASQTPASTSKQSSAKTVNIKKVMAPTFSWRFLLPNYWLIWIGAFILYMLCWLPLPIIRLLGAGFGRLLGLIAPTRVEVAKRNIRLTFPQWSDEQVQQTANANVARTGMALFETGMGWWWPAWRIKKHVRFEGLEEARAVLESCSGIFGLAIHNVNLEMGLRGIGYGQKAVAFYRKHNNPLLDYLQYHGRNRSNKYLVHKRNAKALIQAMDHGELCLYLPDQDYGAKQSVFVPFGGVKDTATTTATLMFANRTSAVPFFVFSQYTKTGYVVRFVSGIDYLADTNKEEALTKLNRDILSFIEEQPDGYLWMHKRFKTRPPSSPESLYMAKE